MKTKGDPNFSYTD